jgi:hypothetical protein
MLHQNLGDSHEIQMRNGFGNASCDWRHQIPALLALAARHCRATIKLRRRAFSMLARLSSIRQDEDKDEPASRRSGAIRHRAAEGF